MMRLHAKIAAGLLTPAALLSAPCVAAQDFRDNFPPQYTDSPLGVNLQTGRFSYWLFSFAMGPFVTERGFGRSGFDFPASIYFTQETASNGGFIFIATVNMGNPAVSLGNPTDLVQRSLRPIGNSWLRGISSSRIGFRQVVVNGVWNGLYANYYNPGSESWRLVVVSGGYQLTNKSGTQYNFINTSVPNEARLSNVIAPDGSRIDVTFDSVGRLVFAQSNRGYAIRYEHLNGGAQVKVCGFNLAQTYATTTTSCSTSSHVVTLNNLVRSDGLLQPTSVVDVMGQTTTVNYGGFEGNFPTCITLPNSSTCEVTNTFGPQPGELPQLTKKDQVRVQNDANGVTYTYGYDFPLSNSDDVPKQPGGPPILSTSWMQGPGYYAQAYYEDGLAKTVASPGDGPHQFEYNGVNVWKAIWPEGNQLQIDRDYVGNARVVTEKPKTGASETPTVAYQTMPEPNVLGQPTLCNAASEKLCDKPTARIDAKGNQTDFTYDPVHGGMLTKTLPAVTQASGVTARPQVRYEYAQRYALIKNSGGGYVQAGTPVWVKTRERTCKTTAASGQSCAGGAADEVITDFDYGPTSGAPNNLLLRGVAVTADGQTLRTCYSYDANGRKLSETQPKAGLTVCP